MMKLNSVLIEEISSIYLFALFSYSPSLITLYIEIIMCYTILGQERH